MQFLLNTKALALYVLTLPFRLFLLGFLYVIAAVKKSNPGKIIDSMDLDVQLKQEAKEHIRAVARKEFATRIYDFTAPLVVPIALLFTKWEDEHLPKIFRKWDNDVSINGDRGNWILDEQGFPKMLPVPIEDTPEARALCYYAKGFHPRSYVARLEWLGWRNRASQASVDSGLELDWTFGFNPQTFGSITDGEGAELTVLTQHGTRYFQLYSQRKTRKLFGNQIIERVNCGYKINMAIGNRRRVANIVYIPYSLKRWSKD